MHIIMPKLGLTMTHGTITEWLKTPGEAVEAEDILCVYETEKVTLELNAPEDGVLIEILAPAGATVPAGAPVCEFRTPGEGPRAAGRESVSGGGLAPGDRVGRPTSGFRPVAGSSVNATPKARVLAREWGLDLFALAGSGPAGRVQAADVAAARAPAQPQPLKATPLARRIAGAEGIDLRSVAGTGPEGTITREDVALAISTQAIFSAEHGPDIRQHEPSSTLVSPAEGQIVPHTVHRRTIAERMTQSAFTAPHVTLMVEAEATNLVSARAQINSELRPGAAADKISYNTLLAALVARALREHPNLNARWEPDGIRLLTEINIALAVDAERGLLTPVLRRTDKLSLPAIHAGYAELAARALAGRSLPGDLVGGTFTITNLGGLEVDGFTPIINPPQAAVLGVGRIVEKPVARDGAVVVRPMITLSLSFDHRIVDGAPAARFLQRVKQLVERPMALLLG